MDVIAALSIIGKDIGGFREMRCVRNRNTADSAVRVHWPRLADHPDRPRSLRMRNSVVTAPGGRAATRSSK